MSGSRVVLATLFFIGDAEIFLLVEPWVELEKNPLCRMVVVDGALGENTLACLSLTTSSIGRGTTNSVLASDSAHPPWDSVDGSDSTPYSTALS